MQDLAALNRSTVARAASTDFIRYAKTLMAARFNHAEAIEIAREVRASARVLEVLEKAPVATGTTTASGWASQLSAYRAMAEGFAASLAPFSAFDRILADGAFYPLPFKTLVSVASSAAKGSSGVISELAALPISSMNFSRVTFEPQKVSASVVFTTEVVRAASPATMNMIGNELRRACALSTDQAFLDEITSETTIASNASTGSTAAAFIHDIEVAARAIELGANSKPYLILSPDTCKGAALLRDTTGNLVFPQMTVTGGVIQGIKVVVSEAAMTGAVLLDASQIAAADDQIVLSEGQYASVEMDDSPTSGAQSLVSLWQNSMVGLKAVRYFGVEALRSTAVALITSVTA